jgi:cell division protein FtsB
LGVRKRRTVEKKLIEKLEQENEALKKRVAELEERMKSNNI